MHFYEKRLLIGFTMSLTKQLVFIIQKVVAVILISYVKEKLLVLIFGLLNFFFIEINFNY
jgi:hypothetical protein